MAQKKKDSEIMYYVALIILVIIAGAIDNYIMMQRVVPCSSPDTPFIPIGSTILVPAGFTIILIYLWKRKRKRSGMDSQL